MADAVKGKYVKGSEGRILKIIDLGLYEKHAGFSVENIFTGEEGSVDVLCSEEYTEIPKTEVKIALNEREAQTERAKKRL